MKHLISTFLMLFTLQTAMAANLNGTAFAKNFPIVNVTNLITDAKGDAYQLSIPLLISASLGNQAVYDDAHKQMNAAMQVLLSDTNKNSFAAWLYGRMMIAADNMNDKNSDALFKLKNLLQNTATKPDRFKAWAYGYLASLNKQEYIEVKPAMQKLAQALTVAYKGENKDKLTASDVLWIWVMVTQAAANADDQKMYQEALQQMMDITHTKTLLAALQQGIPHDDFNQWAMSIVYVSAKKMNQQDLMLELKQSLEQAIKAGNSASPDTMLAQVTYQLSDLKS